LDSPATGAKTSSIIESLTTLSNDCINENISFKQPLPLTTGCQLQDQLENQETIEHLFPFWKNRGIRPVPREFLQCETFEALKKISNSSLPALATDDDNSSHCMERNLAHRKSKVKKSGKDKILEALQDDILSENEQLMSIMTLAMRTY
jgi:hypothetical protein